MIAPQQQLATDPRHIRARFAGYCAETRLRIHAGDWIIYHPLTNDVYCAYSLAYKQFENAKYYQLTH